MYKLYSFVLWLGLTIFSVWAKAQAPVYSVSIPHSQHISANDPDYTDIFRQFSGKSKDEIFAFYTLHIQIYQEKDNQYSITVSFQEDSVTGDMYYKQLSLGDLFYPKRIFVNGNIRANGRNVLPLKIQNQAIPENYMLVDTLLSMVGDTILSWNHKIEYIQFYFDDQLSKNIAARIKKIDAYYQNDSLFYCWNKELDKLNLSNVDLLPIYKFTVDDIEKEANKYIGNQFENLLTLSKLDNSVYLKKVSKLYNRINTIKNYLTSTLPEMDEMLYRKGEEYENQKNYEKAVYYYQRALDYNPTHVQACLALSNYFIEQKNYTKPILILSTLYRDSAQPIENNAVANSLYINLLSSAEEQIKRNDYYSALKILDTVENYCTLMPINFCDTKYRALQQEAKQGIYNAYVDVIHQAIRNQRFVLAVNYTQGLRNLIRKNKDTVEKMFFYQELLEELWTNFSQTMYKNISRKQYIYALTETKEINNTLDSAGISYPESIFNDIYTICYTNLYAEKHAEIEKLKQNKQSKELPEKIKEAEDFYSINKNFIQPNSVSESKNDKATVQQRIAYQNLCEYVSIHSINTLEYDFLDSCELCYKWQQQYQYDTCIGWNYSIENKCKPLILSGFARINTYVWGNEFKKAIPLYEQINKAIYAFSLQNDSLLGPKYLESKSLLQIRGCAYIEKEKMELFVKARTASNANKFAEAENMILSYYTLSIDCKTSPYNDSLKKLLSFIEKPAHFQKLNSQALEKLRLQNYKEGFSLYDEAYSYFTFHATEMYGLSCPDRKQFLLLSKHTPYYVASCEEYIEKKEFDKAMEIMLLAVSQQIPFDTTQQLLGKNYLLYVKEKGLKPLTAIKSYSFTQKYSFFLNAYLGKPLAFLYLLIH